MTTYEFSRPRKQVYLQRISNEKLLTNYKSSEELQFSERMRIYQSSSSSSYRILEFRCFEKHTRKLTLKVFVTITIYPTNKPTVNV